MDDYNNQNGYGKNPPYPQDDDSGVNFFSETGVLNGADDIDVYEGTRSFNNNGAGDFTGYTQSFVNNGAGDFYAKAPSVDDGTVGVSGATGGFREPVAPVEPAYDESSYQSAFPVHANVPTGAQKSFFSGEGIEKPKSKKPIIIGVAVTVVAIIVAIVLIVVFGGKSDEEKTKDSDKNKTEQTEQENDRTDKENSEIGNKAPGSVEPDDDKEADVPANDWDEPTNDKPTNDKPTNNQPVANSKEAAEAALVKYLDVCVLGKTTYVEDVMPHMVWDLVEKNNGMTHQEAIDHATKYTESYCYAASYDGTLTSYNYDIQWLDEDDYSNVIFGVSYNDISQDDIQEIVGMNITLNYGEEQLIRDMYALKIDGEWYIVNSSYQCMYH